MFSVSFSRSELLSFIKALILGSLLGFSIQSLYAWTAPSAAAPGGNVSGPITAGLFTTYQIRNAGLGLTGSLNVSNVGAQNNKVTAPKICLNNDGSETGCITAWPVGGAIGSGNVVAGCGPATAEGGGACAPLFSCWGGATVAYANCSTAGASTCRLSSKTCPAGSTLRETGVYLIQDCGGDGSSAYNGRAFICVGDSAGGGGGGGGTGIDGSGTTSYLPIWTNSTTLGNSILYQNASNQIGIGTTNPSAKLDVNGWARINGQLNLASNRITNVADPTNNQDAATKKYVDDRFSLGAPGTIVAGCMPGDYANPDVEGCWGGAAVSSGWVPGGTCPAGTTRKGNVTVDWGNWPRNVHGGMVCLKN